VNEGEGFDSIVSNWQHLQTVKVLVRLRAVSLNYCDLLMRSEVSPESALVILAAWF